MQLDQLELRARSDQPVLQVQQVILVQLDQLALKGALELVEHWATTVRSTTQLTRRTQPLIQKKL